MQKGRHQASTHESADASANAGRTGVMTPEGVVLLEPGKTYVEATTLGQDIRGLLIKLGIIALALFLLFTLVFGLFRNPNGSMAPAFHDGDLVMFYRLDKSYVANEVTACEINGEVQAMRVIAVEGDSVNITSDGLFVNGAKQSEPSIIEDTLAAEGGATYPLTVGEGQVFLLGDAREHSTDSRMIGCVDISDTQGTVIATLRRRSF